MSFLDSIENKELDWPLSAASCLGSVSFAQQSTELLMSQLENKLRRIYRSKMDPDSPQHLAAVVDYCAPRIARELGMRPKLLTRDDQRSFAVQFSPDHPIIAHALDSGDT